jgi:hypothetical protein
MANTTYKHKLGAIELDTTVMGGQIRGSIRANTQVDRSTSSGEVYPRYQVITEQKPLATWESNNIEAWLAQVGLAAKDIGTLTTGLKLYGVQAQHGATVAAGASHLKYTVKDGIILPRSIQARHRQIATISYDAVATWDGSNDPVTITENQSLPSGLTDVDRFGIGPVDFGGASFVGINSLNIDFGLREEAQGADSNVWDTEASISEVLPEITLRGINPKWFGASFVPLGGLALDHVDCIMYLRKYQTRNSFYANNQNQHLKMTVAGMAYLEDIFDANGQNTGETQLRIPLDYDGTNAPITFTADSQIT